MAAPTWFDFFTRPLEELGVAYMITGSVASMIYAEPRTTLDVDLVLELPLERTEDFLAAFPEARFYRPPLEVVREECARDSRGHFNLIHHDTGFKADVYLAGADSLHHWALARRRRFEHAGSTFTLAPPEYVILRKLEFWREGGSEKHLRDVRGLLMSRLELDESFLLEEIATRGLQDAWQRVRG
jgi:hypothetical protein